MERLTTSALIRYSRPDMKQGMTTVLILQKFEELCGEVLDKSIAPHVKAAYLKGKTLSVRCAHPSVGMEFSFQIPLLLKKMQERGIPVKSIKMV